MEVIAGEDRVAKVAKKNDVFRKLGFGVTITNGAARLPNIIGLMQKIRDNSDFTEDSDPYKEHDFGKLMWRGKKVFIVDYKEKYGLIIESKNLAQTLKKVFELVWSSSNAK